MTIAKMTKVYYNPGYDYADYHSDTMHHSHSTHSYSHWPSQMPSEHSHISHHMDHREHSLETRQEHRPLKASRTPPPQSSPLPSPPVYTSATFPYFSDPTARIPALINHLKISESQAVYIDTMLRHLGSRLNPTRWPPEKGDKGEGKAISVPDYRVLLYYRVEDLIKYTGLFDFVTGVHYVEPKNMGANGPQAEMKKFTQHYFPGSKRCETWHGFGLVDDHQASQYHLSRFWGCFKCGLSLSTAGHGSRHLKACVKDAKLFKCRLVTCGQLFTRADNGKQHERNSHGINFDAKPSEADIKAALLRHELKKRAGDDEVQPKRRRGTEGEVVSIVRARSHDELRARKREERAASLSQSPKGSTFVEQQPLPFRLAAPHGLQKYRAGFYAQGVPVQQQQQQQQQHHAPRFSEVNYYQTYAADPSPRHRGSVPEIPVMRCDFTGAYDGGAAASVESVAMSRESTNGSAEYAMGSVTMGQRWSEGGGFGVWDGWSVPRVAVSGKEREREREREREGGSEGVEGKRRRVNRMMSLGFVMGGN